LPSGPRRRHPEAAGGADPRHPDATAGAAHRPRPRRRVPRVGRGGLRHRPDRQRQTPRPALGAGLLSPDYYLLDELLTDEARAVRDRVRAFVEADLLPVINDYWDR